MYFPSYVQLLESGSPTQASAAAVKNVTLPHKLFKFLLQVALTNSDFDPEHYLDANPDIREAIKRGNDLSPYEYYIRYGYFEGRKGGLPGVDEAWYLRTYPDVAAAIRSGAIKSPTEHFAITGVTEGRAPSVAYVNLASKWKGLLSEK